MDDMAVRAEDVFIEFYKGLLSGRYNVSTLALAMGTSRNQVYVCKRKGAFSPEYITNLARVEDRPVLGYFRELMGIAERLAKEDRKSEPATEGKKERAISASVVEQPPEGADENAPSDSGLPSPRRRKTGNQSQHPKR